MTSEELLLSKIGCRIELKSIKTVHGKINYTISGSGSPLLLIHGANIGWGQWYKNILALSEKYTVIALDLPGSGGSTKLDYKTMNFDDDLVAPVANFITKLKLKHLKMIGHSIGAYVGLRLYLNHNIKYEKLILSEPLGMLKYMPNMYRLVAFYPIAELLSRTVMDTSYSNIKTFLYSSVYAKSSIEDIFTSYCFESLNRDYPHPTILLMHKISGFFNIRMPFVLTDSLPKLRIPTLVVMGKHDPMIPSRSIKEIYNRIPNAEYIEYEQSAHLPFIEESNSFNRDVLFFLSH